MIQFRWRKLDKWPRNDDKLSVADVDGCPCVLEFKQHFIPTARTVVVDDMGNTDLVYVLTEARECDKEWKEVKISG
jgi:hypothetical protein